MSTSHKLSTTKERHTIADVEHVLEKTFTSAGDIRLTCEFDLSTLKSKESLQLQIGGLWKIFCEQALKLISDSSSSETTGQHPGTPSDTLTGQLNTDASPLLARPSRRYG